MPEINQELVEKFKTMAQAVAAKVTEVSTMDEILDYVVTVCSTKEPCEILADEPGTELGPLGPNRVPTRIKRVLAAPQLSDEDFAKLQAMCEDKKILCIRDNLRKYAAGIDIGLNDAVAGVAASGTCMCENNKEDVRLAGMISEISVLVLKKSTIYPDLPAIAPLMREYMGKGPNGTFTTLITGPSRTADIECVGAIGVHGPLELHILLMEA